MTATSTWAFTRSRETCSRSVSPSPARNGPRNSPPRRAAAIASMSGNGSKNSSHDAVLDPGMTPARVEFLVVLVGRLVDGLRIEGSVDIPEQGYDIGVLVADPADLEVVLVDVDDVQPIRPDVDLPQTAQLRASAFEELQGLIKLSRNKIVTS